MTEYLDHESQNYLYEVMNWAHAHDIGVTLTDKVAPTSPSVCWPEDRQVAVNLIYEDTLQIPFQAAHEVGHVMLQHHGVQYFDGHDLTGQEGEAHRYGINLLVPMYFADRDEESVDVYQFMHAFSIPGRLYDYVCESISDYYIA